MDSTPSLDQGVEGNKKLADVRDGSSNVLSEEVSLATGIDVELDDEGHEPVRDEHVDDADAVDGIRSVQEASPAPDVPLPIDEEAWTARRGGAKYGTPPDVPGFSGFLHLMTPRWTSAKPSQRALNSARSTLSSSRGLKNSARSNRSATSLNTSSTSFAGTSSTSLLSSKSPRMTEAQYRRMMVQRENKKRTEDEMHYQRTRRSWQRMDLEQHRLQGAELVAEGREQRERIHEARQNSIASRSNQGSAVKHEVEAIRQELRDQRFLTLMYQKHRVEDTAQLRSRAKQNVAKIREAKGRSGRDERIAARMLEMIRDDERDAYYADKAERAQRVREDTSQVVLGASRAIWEDDKRKVGILFRAYESEGREQREHERQAYVQSAQLFKQEVGTWRASAKEIRERLAAERKTRAQLAREQRERDAELRELEKEQDRRARKETHDSVYTAKFADEDLVAEYCDYEKSIIETAWDHENARATAAVRATMVRRQRRKDAGRLVRRATRALGDSPFLSSRFARQVDLSA